MSIHKQFGSGLRAGSVFLGVALLVASCLNAKALTGDMASLSYVLGIFSLGIFCLFVPFVKRGADLREFAISSQFFRNLLGLLGFGLMMYSARLPGPPARNYLKQSMFLGGLVVLSAASARKASIRGAKNP